MKPDSFFVPVGNVAQKHCESLYILSIVKYSHWEYNVIKIKQTAQPKGDYENESIL